MSILAQQLGLSTSFVGNETNNKKEMMYVSGEIVERQWGDFVEFLGRYWEDLVEVVRWSRGDLVEILTRS